jgi:hypothetical protein
MHRESEGSPPGVGPSGDGAAYISFPGAAVEPDSRIEEVNNTDRDLLTIYGYLNGVSNRTYDGAVSYIIPAKLIGNKTTAQIKFKFWKYRETKAPIKLDVKLWFNKQGASPALIDTHSIIPASTGSTEYSMSADLSASITTDGLYEVWVQLDAEAVNDAIITRFPYAVILQPVDLRLSFDDSADTTRDNTIKMGSTATAWGSLVETTLGRPTPRTLHMDYRGSSTLVWEGDADDAFDLDGQVNKRIQLEVGGSVRFRGRVQNVQRVGDPSAHRYRFNCVDFRGNGRNVDVVADPSGTETAPLRIYNAEPEDPDFLKCISTGSTVGAILQDLIDTHKTIMLAEDALYSTGAGDMYDAGEIAALDFVPGKIQLREVNIEQALLRVLSEMGKSYAMYVDQVDGKYHFYNIRDNGTARDVVVDDDAVTHNIQHSVEGCYTALKLYGSVGSGDNVKKAKIGRSGGYDGSGNALSGLSPAWDTSLEPENAGDWDLPSSLGERDYCVQTSESIAPTFSWIYDSSKAFEDDYWIGAKVWFPKLGNTTWTVTDSDATGVKFGHGIGASPLYDVDPGDPWFIKKETDYVYVFRLYTIDDATARDIIEGGEFSGIDCCPRLFSYGFTNDDPAQGTTSKMALPIRIIKEAFSTPTTSYNSPPYILVQYPAYKGDPTYTYVEALDIALEYCYRATSGGVDLSVRYPTSSYEGTAFTDHSIQRTKTVIVNEYTSPDEDSDFESLADELLKPYKDTRSWGSVNIDSIDWNYADLYSLISLSRDGQSVADLSDVSLIGVRYDFGSEETVLDLSNDFRDGFNYDKLLDRFVKDLEINKDFDEGISHEDYIRCSRGELMPQTRVSSTTEEEIDVEIKTLSDPTWGDFLNGSVSPGKAGTLCDQQTYTEQGTTPGPLAQMFLCGHSMYGQAYFTTTGSKGKVHGVILRPGSVLGGGDDANTHLLYPYLCEGGDPTLTKGKCAVQQKDLEIVVPESTPGTRVNMGDWLPLFLKCYANFIQFTSQGMACMDDRIYRIDQRLWGTGSEVPTEGNLVDKICSMVKVCVSFIAERLSELAYHVETFAARVDVNCGGGHLGGYCQMIVPIGNIWQMDPKESKVDYTDDPVCSAGKISPDCCTFVRGYDPPALI